MALTYFSANMTMRWQEDNKAALLITGQLEAHTGTASNGQETVFRTPFTSRVLSQHGLHEAMDGADFDEEVGENGQLDLGEIATQYLILNVHLG